MSDIDDKLRELDLEFLHGVPVHLNEGMVAQIKQAFADEENTKGTFKSVDGGDYHKMMTGAEWYVLIEDALSNITISFTDISEGVYVKKSDVLAAAKKAAGL